jgi:predicted ATP-dependent endonuclease of OLD family
MKSIDVEINGFGKIKQAKFQIKKFTVIAGKNASGKSFITRALYSIFSSLNKDHLSIEFDEPSFRLQRFLSIIETIVDKPSVSVREHLAEMRLGVKNLVNNIDLIFHQKTLVSQIEDKDILSHDLQQLQQELIYFNDSINSIEKYRPLLHYLKLVQAEIKKLESLMKTPHDSLANALAKQLEQAFTNNFQVNGISKLKNRDCIEIDTTFNFGKEIGHLNVESNHVKFELSEEGIDAFQSLDNVVYLESPMYWKIKDALKSWVEIRNHPSLRRRLKHQQKELKKIPEYVLDTFTLLDADIVQGEPHPDLMQLSKTINKCIGGHIQISDGGELQFLNQNENGEHYFIDLNQTATGATALGIIALLLDKHIIVPNSVLIFDEPEVNLHPAWQQVMIQVLYQLSAAGVKIVMASHSFDMMEAIEKLMDTHEEKGKDVNEHFSIVQLDNGMSINHDKPIFKKLDAVKADLGMPLFNLFSDL